jgi:ATP adenylyltransferase
VRTSRDDATNLVVHRGRRNFIILNRYPYNNGHLMIVPNAHLSALGSGTRDQRAEMMELAARCEEILRRVYRIDGMNLGMNLGTPAGAGVLGHFHLHLVPRWAGDTNFITVVGRTRVTPESLRATYERLAPEFGRRRVRRPRPRRAGSAGRRRKR